MSNQRLFKNVIQGTLLSVLIFLSVSFVTVLTQINPVHYYKNGEPYRLDIGFPFRFYQQFWLRGSEIPNSGWFIGNLFYDCILTWMVIVGLFVLIKWRQYKKAKHYYTKSK